MSGVSGRWFKRRLDKGQDSHQDPNADEMASRAMHALEASIEAQTLAAQHTEEAQRLFGAIRREIAVTKAREVRPQ